MDGRKDHDGMSTAYQNLTPAKLREEYAAVKAQFDDKIQAKYELSREEARTIYKSVINKQNGKKQ